MSLPNDPSTRVPWGYAREKCVSYELCRPGYTLVCQHSPLPQSHPPFPATSQLCIHSSAEMHLAPPRRALQKTVNLPVRPKIVRRTRTLSLSLSLPFALFNASSETGIGPPFSLVENLCSSSCSFDERKREEGEGGEAARNTIRYLGGGIGWQVGCKALEVDWGR